MELFLLLFLPSQLAIAAVGLARHYYYLHKLSPIWVRALAIAPEGEPLRLSTTEVLLFTPAFWTDSLTVYQATYYAITKGIGSSEIQQ